MTFMHPAALLLALPLALGVAYAYRRGLRRGMAYSVLHRVPVARGWRVRAAAALPAVAALGLLLMIIALARPHTAIDRIPRATESIAIQMVIDVSGSMNALDMAPLDASGIPLQDINRLDAIKPTIRQFIEQRPNDLIGLITFGGFPLTRAPLTLDHRALKHFVSAIAIPQGASEGGLAESDELMTAIGDALALACARLRDTQTASKIVVLLSDGESNAGLTSPAEAADIAAQLGIKVYTVAVGRAGRVPVRVPDGRIQYTFMGFNPQELRNIADTTGGFFFDVADPDGLAGALEHINRLETTRVEDVVHVRRRELFASFLWPGALLLFGACSLNVWLSKRMV